jgi:hypothetical protein
VFLQPCALRRHETISFSRRNSLRATERSRGKRLPNFFQRKFYVPFFNADFLPAKECDTRTIEWSFMKNTHSEKICPRKVNYSSDSELEIPQRVGDYIS